MTTLADRVAIDRRFARSARIDTDLGGTPPLAGYVLQASVAKALSTLATAQAESRQGAFTWTGPYGGGKSSAALLVASLVGGADEQRGVAREIVGEPLDALFADAFPAEPERWGIVAVTGHRTGLRDAIAEAATASFGWSAKAAATAAGSDKALIDAIAAEGASDRGGVLVVLDELGKLLEHEAATGGDAHLLQDIAERASRSDGRLVVVGILHQSFEQYAERADREARREWAKVQGRFHDIAFLAGADETVALLGRAIASEPPASAVERAATAAEAVAKRRPADAAALAALLAETWPLNPVTALLLGPVSRQRFAQNERSVFGFLASAEPAGFQEFLSGAADDATYDPALLWDYLAANFGMALASGPDGARFSLAFEAVERAGARGGAIHVALTKAAAVIEFFRNGSGVALADDFLALSLPAASARDLAAAVADLLDWAVLIRQPRLGGYALFAGSDFDLDEAIGRATAPLSAEELAALPDRVGLGTVSAKRHYFETGTLRSFHVAIAVAGADAADDAIVERVASCPARGGGTLLLLLGDGGLSESQLDGRARRIAAALDARGAIAAVGTTRRSFHLRSGAEEMLAIERVVRDHPQLEGDRIARREISARMSAATEELHQLLDEALGDAKWRLSTSPGTSMRDRTAVVASALAAAGYPDAPVIRSELLQRDRPSSSAMAALRELCRAMVAHGDLPDLGIDGFPAERGLYLTLLKPLGLHTGLADGTFAFRAPPSVGDGASLRAAWNVLQERDGTLADAFETWRKPPFGMKAGIMPAMALAYLLANRSDVALYVDDVFQSEIDDLVVDRLLQKPGALRIRRLDRSVQQTAFLAGLADQLGLPGTTPALPVAQALFRRVAKLPQYAKRTSSLEAGATAIRDAVMRSNDPEALLFDALPAAMDGTASGGPRVLAALEACEGAYPRLLDAVRTALARALGTDSGDFHGVAARAETIRNLTNDFAFEAFCTRAAAFDGGGGDVEGLASLLVHKPAHSWSDRDREQALLELARLGRRFREAEALATVRDRRSSTEALALVVGVDPLMPPLLSTFELTENEKTEATALAEDLLARLAVTGPTAHMRLAALARAVASVAGEMEAA
ncbi:hypothetical protein [Sphingomonas sp. 28-62-11]|uniref:hypothetical protein n=1 Tax=Sphingomonas sp. 28-62-11 TaxID=1970432 RepID=UPI000BD9F217|nr:MAG: ATP-binding protein [Sphingomonas sp. 28-62-11]